MNGTATALLVAAAVLAAGDWIAVGVGNRVAEYVLKPATMLPLIGAAVVLDPVDRSARVWFVVALVCSLAGDVFLMLPDEQTFFVPGLASFLVGHVAYVIGLLSAGVTTVALIVGIAVVVVAMATVGPIVVRGARRTDPRLGIPVTAYVSVISVMVACAIGSTVPIAVIGALLFYLSDLAIGWSSFVKPFAGQRLVIITTYHVAQICLVASLVVAR